MTDLVHGMLGTVNDEILIIEQWAQSDYKLRLPRDQVDEIRRALAEAGIKNSRGAEFAHGPALELVIALGAGAVPLARVIKAYIERHRGKKVVYRSGKERVEISGLSADEIVELITKVRPPALDVGDTDRSEGP